jgi:hypothetical protein
MKFNLVVEIDDQYIDEYIKETNIPEKALRGMLSNACYLGLDCTNAIIMRQFGFGVCNTYVKTQYGDKTWGQLWGDNFPTEEECPTEVIDHHASVNNVIASDDIINFARAMWNEGNLTEKLS